MIETSTLLVVFLYLVGTVPTRQSFLFMTEKPLSGFAVLAILVWPMFYPTVMLLGHFGVLDRMSRWADENRKNQDCK